MESNACAASWRIVKELLQEQARAANAELVIQAVPLDAVAGVFQTILGRDGAAGRRLDAPERREKPRPPCKYRCPIAGCLDTRKQGFPGLSVVL